MRKFLSLVMALVLGFTFAGAQTVYFVNAPGWSEVKIHMWGGNGTTWPGLSMTKTSDKILEKDVYTASIGDNTSLLFHNNAGTQTVDQTWNAATPYFYNNQWYASAAAIEQTAPGDEYTVLGTSTLFGAGHDWDLNNAATLMVKQTDGSYKCTIDEVTLSANTEYKWKVVTNHAWGSGEYPASGDYKLTVEADGKYKVEFTLVVGTGATALATLLENVVVTHEYTVLGDPRLFGQNHNWDLNNAATLMVQQEDGSYKCTIDEVALQGDSIYKWKVVTDHAWGSGEYPSQGDYLLTVENDGNYKVEFTLVVGTGATAQTTSLDPTGQPGDEHTYKIYGSIAALGSWVGDSAKVMPNGVFEIQLEAGVECLFKVFVDDWSAILGYDAVNLECSSEGVVISDEEWRNIKVVMAETGILKVEVVEGQLCVTGNFVVEEEVHTYRIFGSVEALHNWDGENLVDMPNGVIEIQLESGVECQFKVVVDNWAAELGYDAVNLECSSEGVVLSDEQYRNVKVVMAETGTLKVEVVEGKLCVTGNFVVPETMKYYLVGTMTNWTVVAEDQYLFSETAVPGEYMLHTTLTEGQGIKVAGVLGEQQIWYIDGEGNEYVADAAHAGAVVIYFRPAGNTEWSDLAGHIYVAIDEQTGIQNTASDVKAQKFIENGQLYILVNGKVYTVTGIAR